MRRESVSYTHLDVYKRQISRFHCICLQKFTSILTQPVTILILQAKWQVLTAQTKLTSLFLYAFNRTYSPLSLFRTAVTVTFCSIIFMNKGPEFSCFCAIILFSIPQCVTLGHYICTLDAHRYCYCFVELCHYLHSSSLNVICYPQNCLNFLISHFLISLYC